MKKLFFSGSTTKQKAKCKFSKTCNLYSVNSHTCMHTGGNYCGRYRKLNEELKAPSEVRDIYVIHA